MPTARGHSRVSARHRLRVRRAKTAKRESRSPKGIITKIVFVLCSLFFVLGLWNLYNSWKNSQWITGTRITAVVASADPKIYSFNPQASKLTIMAIPTKTQISASGGRGEWLAGSLWKLGEQEKLGGQVLAQSLQNTLGLPIDGWAEEPGAALFVNRKLGFVSAFIEAVTSSRIKTNLTFFDRLQILLQVGTVGFSGRRELDLVSSGAVRAQKLADGEEGYVVIPEKAKIAFEEIRDDLVFAEGKKLKVFNTSKKAGLAAEVTRVITTLGLWVISTGSSDEAVEDCQVRGDSQNTKSISARRLAAVLGCKVSDKDTGGPEDLELWLGESFAQRF